MCLFIRSFSHSRIFCYQKPIVRCTGIFFNDSIEVQMSSGQPSSDVFDPFEDGFGVHIFKCSLISDLYDFVRLSIQEIIKKKTIIFTTFMVICVNI